MPPSNRSPLCDAGLSVLETCSFLKRNISFLYLPLFFFEISSRAESNGACTFFNPHFLPPSNTASSPAFPRLRFVAGEVDTCCLSVSRPSFSLFSMSRSFTLAPASFRFPFPRDLVLLAEKVPTRRSKTLLFPPNLSLIQCRMAFFFPPSATSSTFSPCFFLSLSSLATTSLGETPSPPQVPRFCPLLCRVIFKERSRRSSFSRSFGLLSLYDFCPFFTITFLPSTLDLRLPSSTGQLLVFPAFLKYLALAFPPYQTLVLYPTPPPLRKELLILRSFFFFQKN